VSVYVEAEPARPLGEGDGTLLDALATPLVEGLRQAYLWRVERFTREYGRVVGLAPTADLTSAYKVAQYPVGDGEVEPVIIDEDLFSTLFAAYLCEGWPAVESVEVYLFSRATEEGESGEPFNFPGARRFGGIDGPWVLSYRFFVFARNMLAVLIRDALIEIERHAATFVVGQLDTSARRLAGAVAELGLKVRPDGSWYSENGPAMKALTTALGDVVRLRVQYDAIVASLGQLGEQLVQLTRYPVQPRPDPTPTAAEVAARIAANTALRDQTLKLYQAAKAVLAENSPVALLIVEGLKVPVLQKDVEAKLGAALAPMYGRIDDIARAVHPDRSRVAAILPGLPAPPAVPGRPPGPRDIATPIDPQAIQDLRLPAAGPELAVFDVAREGLTDDPGLLPLLHEQTWRLLVARGEIATDSIANVVLHHYLLAMDRRLAELDRARQHLAAFFRSLGRMSAAASVALLFTPLGEVAPVFRGLALLADAAALAYQVHTVIEGLAEFDQATDAQLLAPDAAGVRGLAAVGSLMVARHEYATQLTETLLRELLMMAASSVWRTARIALITRGFMADMEAILDVDEES
jgi:hypothetical protein